MTEEKIIDPAALKRLLSVIGGDEEDLAELVEDFSDGAPDLAQKIVNSAENGDANSMRIAAHTLKSNARDFGADHLAKLCASMERALKVESPGDLGWAADEIQAETARAIAALMEVSLEDV